MHIYPGKHSDIAPHLKELVSGSRELKCVLHDPASVLPVNSCPRCQLQYTYVHLDDCMRVEHLLRPS